MPVKCPEERDSPFYVIRAASSVGTMDQDCPKCGQKMHPATIEGKTRVMACLAGHTLPAPEPKRNKYGVSPKEDRTVDGVTLDSKKEAKQWGELQARQRAGEIVGLTRQVRFPLVVNGQTIETYVADFLHFDLTTRQWVITDSKGMRTRDYRRKARWMKQQFGLAITET